MRKSMRNVACAFLLAIGYLTAPFALGAEEPSQGAERLESEKYVFLKDSSDHSRKMGSKSFNLTILCSRLEGCKKSDLDAKLHTIYMLLNPDRYFQSYRVTYDPYRREPHRGGALREQVWNLRLAVPATEEQQKAKRDYLDKLRARLAFFQENISSLVQFDENGQAMVKPVEEIAVQGLRPGSYPGYFDRRVIPYGDQVGSLTVKRSSELHQRLVRGIQKVHTGFIMDKSKRASLGANVSIDLGQASTASRTNEATRTHEEMISGGASLNLAPFNSFNAPLGFTGSWMSTDRSSHSLSTTNTGEERSTVRYTGTREEEVAYFSQVLFPEPYARTSAQGASSRRYLHQLTAFLNPPLNLRDGRGMEVSEGFKEAWREEEPRPLVSLQFLPEHNYVDTELPIFVSSRTEFGKQFHKGRAATIFPWFAMRDEDGKELRTGALYKLSAVNSAGVSPSTGRYLVAPREAGVGLEFSGDYQQAGRFALGVPGDQQGLPQQFQIGESFQLQSEATPSSRSYYLACQRDRSAEGAAGVSFAWLARRPTSTDRLDLSLRPDPQGGSYTLWAQCTLPSLQDPSQGETSNATPLFSSPEVARFRFYDQTPLPLAQHPYLRDTQDQVVRDEHGNPLPAATVAANYLLDTSQRAVRGARGRLVPLSAADQYLRDREGRAVLASTGRALRGTDPHGYLLDQQGRVVADASGNYVRVADPHGYLLDRERQAVSDEQGQLLSVERGATYFLHRLARLAEQVAESWETAHRRQEGLEREVRRIKSNLAAMEAYEGRRAILLFSSTLQKTLQALYEPPTELTEPVFLSTARAHAAFQAPDAEHESLAATEASLRERAPRQLAEARVRITGIAAGVHDARVADVQALLEEAKAYQRQAQQHLLRRAVKELSQGQGIVERLLGERAEALGIEKFSRQDRTEVRAILAACRRLQRSAVEQQDELAVAELSILVAHLKREQFGFLEELSRGIAVAGRTAT